MSGLFVNKEDEEANMKLINKNNYKEKNTKYKLFDPEEEQTEEE